MRPTKKRPFVLARTKERVRASAVPPRFAGHVLVAPAHSYRPDGRRSRSRHVRACATRPYEASARNERRSGSAITGLPVPIYWPLGSLPPSQAPVGDSVSLYGEGETRRSSTMDPGDLRRRRAAGAFTQPARPNTPAVPSSLSAQPAAYSSRRNAIAMDGVPSLYATRLSGVKPCTLRRDGPARPHRPTVPWPRSKAGVSSRR